MCALAPLAERVLTARREALLLGAPAAWEGTISLPGRNASYLPAPTTPVLAKGVFS